MAKGDGAKDTVAAATAAEEPIVKIADQVSGTDQALDLASVSSGGLNPNELQVGKLPVETGAAKTLVSLKDSPYFDRLKQPTAEVNTAALYAEHVSGVQRLQAKLEAGNKSPSVIKALYEVAKSQVPSKENFDV